MTESLVRGMVDRFMSVLLLMVVLCSSVEVRAQQREAGVPGGTHTGGSAPDLPAVDEAVEDAVGDGERFNPLGGMAFHTLENGMRVWLQPWPEAETVFVSAALAVGGSADPPGKEGLAHYVEHVLFTAVQGLSESEFKEEVSARGGVRNGSTNADRTHYWLEVPTEHRAFALDWMHRLMFNKVFDADNIRNQLNPILLEGEEEMKPKGPAEYFKEWVASPDWSQKEPFWEYELGIHHEFEPVLGTWESLHRISPEDIKTFYEQHYGPQNILLVVAGGFDPDVMLQEVRDLFESQPRHGETRKFRREAKSREGHRSYHEWEDREDSVYELSVKLPNLAASDVETLWLVRRMLRAELQEQLRNLEDKSVYSVRVSSKLYWGSYVLRITTNCKTERLEHVRTVVHDTLERLARGEDVALFKKLQKRVVDQLLVAYQTPSDVGDFADNPLMLAPDERWVLPDLVSAGRRLTPTQLADWMQQHVRPSQMVENTTRASPIGVEWLFVVTFGIFWALMMVARRYVAEPVDLTRLRYLRKIRLPAFQWFVVLLGMLIAGVLSTNIVETLFLAVGRTVSQVPVFALDFGLDLFQVVLQVWLLLMIPSLVPRKVLLFEHEWRIKFWSWRSTAYRWSDVREVQTSTMMRVLAQRRFLTIPISLSPFGRGLYVRVGRHLGFFFRTRDDDETLAQMRALQSAAVRQD